MCKNKCYSNIEREALDILHALEKFHHYCFAHEVNIITNHKPLVAILEKDVTGLLHRLQEILLSIHQYNKKSHASLATTIHHRFIIQTQP